MADQKHDHADHAAAIAANATAFDARVNTLTELVTELARGRGGSAREALAQYGIDVTSRPNTGGIDVEHLNERGLAKRETQNSEFYAAWDAKVKAAAVKAHRDGNITAAQRDDVLQRLGYAPLRKVWKVSVTGAFSFDSETAVDQLAVTEQLAAALRPVAGATADLSQIRLGVREEVA